MDELLKVASSWTLPTACVVAVLSGLLIPKRTHDQIVAAKDAQISYLQRAHDAQADRADRLMVTGELARTVLGSLPSVSEGHPPSDGHT